MRYDTDIYLIMEDKWRKGWRIMEDQIRDSKLKGEMGECRIYSPHLIGYFRAALPMSSSPNTVLYLFFLLSWKLAPGIWVQLLSANPFAFELNCSLALILFFFKFCFVLFWCGHLKNLYWICYNIAPVLCFVFFGCEACGILAPRPGMEPRLWKVKS